MLDDILEIQKSGWRVAFLKELLESYGEGEVAFYGTGSHTELLLNELKGFHHRIAVLIDRDPVVAGERKYGFNVSNLESAIKLRVKVIIISSIFEEEIIKRINHVSELGIKVVGLYNDEAKERGQSNQYNSTRNLLIKNKGYKFIDRSKGSNKLLVVLAGYKEYLWPYTLQRIAHYTPENIDICVTSAGKYCNNLAEWAERYGWSYLSTNINDVSLSQNLAIFEHLQAEWIYKLDEDMFVSGSFFDSLLSGFEMIESEGLYRPGFVAPLINVNGYSYVEFLKILGIQNKYKEIFGELIYSANEIKCHTDGNAAVWLWEHSLPFENIAEKLSENQFNYSVVPHRFSIGAILFKRSFWREIGGFLYSAKEGILGTDEAELCRRCMDASKVMCVAHNVFAGHFSFYHQEDDMKQFLLNKTYLFEMGMLERIHS
ncbi:hypothetical protein [Paenibacillus sp. PAMC21692]|uniref:hypothetical protein n=1 Tax=Paenibacillus sp. PAMC21692 TaxID=2762320 RepID=UPI00164D6A38|nr:hypothetical protein [Paenibacillus sp. PAMC21692]QNK58369.1 hypothetical protein H7F31_05400 [Paenibacillus sp. PAMC21692]